MMEHKGYIGVVEFDPEARLFHGDVMNTRDVITFQGRSVDEIDRSFRESVDDYLEWCAKDGVEPEKPYSGRFNLRLSPELHKRLAVTARRRKISINALVEKAIVDELSAVP